MKFLGINIPFTGRGKKDKIEGLLSPRTYEDPLVELPANGGRSREEVIGTVLPTDSTAVTGIGLSRRPLTERDYNELYDLAIKNHDVSFAVSNIVELANTSLNIRFDKGVSDRDAQQMIKAIKKAEKDWFSGGRTMLINALLRQVAITGAISAEAKPRKDLKGVGRVVRLSPKWVYFFYDYPTATYKPYQKTIVGPLNVAFKDLNTTGYGYNALSERTYQYIAISVDEDKPYAIPPMFSALEAICIEKDMLTNLKAVIKRLGMFGFLQVVVNAPTRGKDESGKPESNEAYIQRVRNYLASVEPEIEKGLRNGYVITSKQVDGTGQERKTEFNMTGSTSDAMAGAKLLELIMQIKAAGLKQDPVFLGKNFTTSEALAKVLLKKFAGQLEDYQYAVSSFLQFAYELHLRLLGFEFDYIEVAFEPAILEDTKTLYEGLNQKFLYGKSLYDQGIINQQQFAQLMGYDAAAETEPLAASTAPNEGEEPPAPVTGGEQIEAVADQKTAIPMSLTQKAEKAYLSNVRGYNKESLENLRSAAGFITERFLDAVRLLSSDTPLDSVLTWLEKTVLINWNTAYTERQKVTTARWVEKAYRTFRADKSIFRGKRTNPAGEKIKDSYLTPFDGGLIGHFKATDTYALGKAVFNANIMEELKILVTAAYKNGALPFKGKEVAALKVAGLRRAMGKEIEKKSGAIVRLTGTTMANIRASAGVLSLEQAGFSEYEISGNAAITCTSCSPTLGVVKTAVNILGNYVSAGARNVLTPPKPLLSGDSWVDTGNGFEVCRCRVFAPK